MKRIILSIALLSGMYTYAQNNITTSASDAWTGWMNWFDLSMNYVSGSVWQVADLKTDLVMSPGVDQVILYPNFNAYGDGTDPYWVDQSTGAGLKIMEASTYVEPGATFNGQDLTFTGDVVSNTLDQNYQAKYFIKALDPANNYQDVLNGAYVLPLPASGDFTVTVSGSELAAGLIVQYGFSITGVCANPTDEAALGNVVIEGSTLNLTDNIMDTKSIFPNPATSALNVNDFNEFDSYSIISNDGKIVLTGSIGTGSLNIESLESGMYLISFAAKNGSRGEARFVKE